MEFPQSTDKGGPMKDKVGKNGDFRSPEPAKRTRHRRSRRVIAFFMACLMLIGSLPLGVRGISAEGGHSAGASGAPQNADYGAFRNVTNFVQPEEGHENLCKRHLTGDLRFDWPEPSTYVDVVFIQDFSYSFANTIESVGQAVNQMIGALHMGRDSSGNPKDRAMIVTFRDCKGYGYVDRYGGVSLSTDQGGYQIGGTELTDDQDALRTWVDDNYHRGSLDGGTPTLDGLAQAKERYRKATDNDAVYNRSTYEVGGREMHRKTVYVLITDGAANSASWKYLSEASKKQMGIRDTDYWNRYMTENGVEDGIFDEFGNYVPKTVPYADIPFLWCYREQRPDGVFYYGGRPIRTEAYEALLTALEDESQTIREQGGLRGKTSSYGGSTVVTAFWEDRYMLGGTAQGFGSGWTRMSEKIRTSMLNMAGGNEDFFATSSTDIGDFSDKLVKSFKSATSSVFDQIRLKAETGLRGTAYRLMKKNGSGDDSWTEITPGPQSKDDGRELTVDMSGAEPGSYRLVYEMVEEEFKNEDYSPASIKMIFEGIETPIASGSSNPNHGRIPKNERKDCSISLNKLVSSGRDISAGGESYQELETQRQPFYFSTNYTFTKKVHEATGSMTIRDVLDSRLEILDAWIIATNPTAKSDAVTGATEQGSLIAELKGSDDHSAVPAIAKDGQTLTYALPKQPRSIGAFSYPFAGYDGKQYTLAVKVRLKDSVTDAQIEAMQENDPQDNRKKGIPNTAELLLDDKVIESNRVKAVPPRTVPPTVKKFIKTVETDGWSDREGALNDSGEIIRYSLDAPMPEDTSGYTRFILEDDMDPALAFDGGVRLIYGAVDVNQNVMNPTEIPSDGYTLNQTGNRLTVTLEDREILKALGGNTLSLEFNARVREDADLTPYYQAGIKRFEIPNAGRVRTNEFSYVPSNEVKAVLKVPPVILKKIDSGASEETLLPGAEFSVKEQGGPERRVVTGKDGTARIGDLEPSKTYEVRELKAPEGYVADHATSWTVTVDAKGHVRIQRSDQEFPSEGMEIVAGNVKPQTPVPVKSMKGSNPDAKFEKPDEENPYRMSNIGERLTYRIEVPITSTAGYSDLKISDTVDENLIPDWDTFEVKTVTEDGKETDIAGNLQTTGKRFVWTKTTDFEAVKASVVIRFEARVNPAARDALFADGKDGKLRNTATLQLNGGPEIRSNTVVSQLTRGKVSIRKTVQDNGSKKPLPEGMEATFTLYRVVGVPDRFDVATGTMKPGSGDSADLALKDVVVRGGVPSETDHLDSGSYYYLEKEAPPGYLKAEGKLPAEGTLDIPANGGVVTVPGIEVNDVKATDPTIQKSVRGVNRQKFSTEDYPVEIGEVWEYAVDVLIPETVDTTADYLVVDDVNKVLIIEETPTVESDRTGEMTADEFGQSLLVKPTGWDADRNHVELKIPKESVGEYRGKTIRIRMKVRNAGNINFLSEQVLVDGKLPNTVYLYKQTTDKKIGESTVRVIPKILRSVSFRKVLGNRSLSGATFTLYPYQSGSIEEITAQEPVKHPFSGEPMVRSSDHEGMVKFPDVPAGEYSMVETKAPSGTLLPYDSIHVVVSKDSRISDGDDNAVIFLTPDGRKLSGKGQKTLQNNELITFPVEKKWVGDEGLKTRPQEVKMALYRVGGDLKEPEKMAEIALNESNGWKHTFETPKDAAPEKRLYRYGVKTNRPYRYYAEELSGPEHYAASVSIDGREVINTLKTKTLRLIKRDGTDETPLKGAEFTLTDPNGKVLRAESDASGILTFPEVKYGVIYRIQEVPTEAVKDYMVGNRETYVEIGNDGVPRFTPDNHPFIDPDRNPETKNSGYLFLNHKKPSPIKKINGVQEYSLKQYTEEVTYTIEVPLKGTDEINHLTVEDRVDDAMLIIGNSVDVYEKDTPDVSRKDDFVIDLGADLKTVRYSAGGHQVRGSENKTLVFSFKARIAVGPEKLKDLHPDSVVPNTGTLILNHRPDLTIDTNRVDLKVNYHTVKLQKKLARVQKDPEPADIYRKATFRLVLQRGVWDDAPNRPKDDMNDIVLATRQTGEDGTLTVDGLLKGMYRFEETEAPYGYNRAEPLVFEVNGNEPVLSYEVVDSYEELPTLNKQVKGHEPDARLNKSYDMPTWSSGFTYVVDMEVPSSAWYQRTEFEDVLPVGIIVERDEDISVEIGTGTGDDFRVDTQAPINQVLPVIKPKIRGEVDGRQRLYIDSMELSKEGVNGTTAIFKALRGKTLRFIYRARIRDGYKDIDQFTTDGEGYIVNTAHLYINTSFEQTSDAKVKPTDRYGAVLQKIADFKRKDGADQPLSGAVFRLERYVNEGTPSGPALPEGFPTEYTSDADGFVTIGARLIPGKYRLTEKTPPYEFKDESGQIRNSDFASVYRSFILETGVDVTVEGKVMKGIRFYGVNENSEETILFEGISSREQPVKITNRQLVTVPVIKRWEDEENRHGQRPETITLTLQRAVVKGIPDRLQPDGSLKPEDGDEADVPDTMFNEAAATNPFHRVTWKPDGNPYVFSSDESYRFNEQGESLNYYVKEEVPQGYRANFRTIKTSSIYEQVPGDMLPTAIEITNTLNTSVNFRLQKVDDSDAGRAVKDAVFTLSYEKPDGEIVTRTEKTGADGRIDFGSQAPGRTYVLRETQAPTGYQKNETVYTLIVDGNGVIRAEQTVAGKPGVTESVPEKDFFRTEAVTGEDPEPARYTLRIVNRILKTPKPVKTVNGAEEYRLKRLKDDLTYVVNVPVARTDCPISGWKIRCIR